MSQPSGGKILALKLLLTNNQAGSLIGLDGKAIRDLMEVTGARVNVSSNVDTYPGTTDRIVVITGDFDSVSLAQTMVWEMIGLLTLSEGRRDAEWNPKDVVNDIGQNDDVEVTCKLTVPAAAAGLLLGKGGSNIQATAEESGAAVNLNGKDEAMFTQERIMTISGALGSCVKATNLVLHKLDEPAEPIAYVYRGTTYSSPHVNGSAFVLPYGAAGGYGSNVPFGSPGSGQGRKDSRGGANRGGQTSEQDNGSALAQMETTITLNVPDELVGNILGKQGATMREIIAISRAKVTVSPR
jgi:RNA-binding protein Nova